MNVAKIAIFIVRGEWRPQFPVYSLCLLLLPLFIPPQRHPFIPKVAIKCMKSTNPTPKNLRVHALTREEIENIGTKTVY